MLRWAWQSIAQMFLRGMRQIVDNAGVAAGSFGLEFAAAAGRHYAI